MSIKDNLQGGFSPKLFKNEHLKRIIEIRNNRKEKEGDFVRFPAWILTPVEHTTKSGTRTNERDIALQETLEKLGFDNEFIVSFILSQHSDDYLHELGSKKVEDSEMLVFTLAQYIKTAADNKWINLYQLPIEKWIKGAL